MDGNNSTLESMLYRSGNIHIVLDSSNDAVIHSKHGTYRIGEKGLEVLLRAHRPISVRKLLSNTVGESTEREIKEYLRSLKILLSSGALANTPPAEVSSSQFPFGGYSSSFIQIKMLNDLTRKTTYLDAVKQGVNKGDVVIDLGTGSGIMAIAAVKAGAKKVYAIEPSSIIHIAEENAKINGVAERIEFIRDWSSGVKLDERADVLITDLIGNDPFDLEIWETIHDVDARLLKSDAVILPGEIKLQAQFAEVPEDVIEEHLISEKHIAEWGKSFGIDFSGYVSHDFHDSVGWMEKPSIVQQWQIDDRIEDLGIVSLREKPSAISFRKTMRKEGRKWNAILLSYSAKLGFVDYSSNPQKGTSISHWYVPVWLIPKALSELDVLKVEYRYIGDGESVLDFSPLVLSDME